MLLPRCKLKSKPENLKDGDQMFSLPQNSINFKEERERSSPFLSKYVFPIEKEHWLFLNFFTVTGVKFYKTKRTYIEVYVYKKIRIKLALSTHPSREKSYFGASSEIQVQ